ncbi:MAG: UDP-N-acetylmuramoyl-L-alanyl-D-glutamate--2,6-diaminopimelate ligase, partial [Candidatus Eisenbacteria bacterium]|nr:UDP-N-acetylmuramoyl-L-alanyl-D-glutamate--2,6-diaminopimelate ligase [Candidatus Eisenbacteria bacterium]
MLSLAVHRRPEAVFVTTTAVFAIREAAMERTGITRSARLSELTEAAGVSLASGLDGLTVTSVEYDSRKVGAGALFVAIRGLTTDGHRYVGEARRRGAVAALVEDTTGESGFPEIVVPDTRAALGLVSHAFYGRPSDRLATHAITGTNGKTTTSYLIDSIFRTAGMKTGVVGTLGYRVGDRTFAGDMTSPESLDLARLLDSMVASGTDSVAMEVSSHALALNRTAGMTFDTATLTNVSRDHLDFHGSIEEYAAAKALLFDQIAGDGWKEGATAIINTDDDFGRRLAARVRGFSNVRLLTYGWNGADVSVTDARLTTDGSSVLLGTPSGEVSADIKLVSVFNVMNALAAAAIAVSQGIAPEIIGVGLERVDRVSGRLETVDAGQPFAIVVDYAHTPDALAKVLTALRGTTARRVITVFGCGGDRDRGKRPMMGEIAASGSDLVFITSDNPRTENPGAILEQIAAGARPTGGAFEIVEDRREAIERAVDAA